MPFILNNLLEKIPDFFSLNHALQWIEEGKRRIEQLSPDNLADTDILSLEWGQITENFPASQPPSFFGLFQLEKWRKFVLATYFADLVSYNKQADQVDFERLLFVMHKFPRGFRTWWIKCSHDSWWPIGYTAWYPMLETTFLLFEKNPEKMTDRMVVPFSYGKSPYIYLFNVSVAPECKRKILTKPLMKNLSEDIEKQKGSGLACVVVAEDGIRMAHRFGMTFTGYLTTETGGERAYAVRL